VLGRTIPFAEVGPAHAAMGRGEDVFGNVAVLLGAARPGLGRA
jgi:crotonyl-CoA carboxylase/reductase